MSFLGARRGGGEGAGIAEYAFLLDSVRMGENM